MTLETVNYQCPTCNGALHYSGATNKLECDYCQSSFDVAYIEAEYAKKEARAEENAAKAAAAEKAKAESAAERGEENAFADPNPSGNPVMNNTPWAEAANLGIRSFICSSCGAQLTVDATTAVTECPYCSNPTVLPGTLTDLSKPDYVLPFNTTKQQALDALKKHYASKKFLPDSFTEKNHLEHIQGVYVPFWLYASETHFDATMEATNSRTFVTKREQVTQTDHYNVHRAGSVSFLGVPVDGSSKMPDAHMDAIEPFDYQKLQPFAMSYLPGFVAERFDQDKTVCSQRARQRMEASIPSLAMGTVQGYQSVTPLSCSVNVAFNRADYALLPVWMLCTKWQDQGFLFAMNGQTGKLIGDLPVDQGKVRRYFVKVFLIAFVVTFIIAFILLFLMGGD